MKNLQEQTDRIKQLFGEERLWGNLVNESTTEETKTEDTITESTEESKEVKSEETKSE